MILAIAVAITATAGLLNGFWIARLQGYIEAIERRLGSIETTLGDKYGPPP